MRQFSFSSHIRAKITFPNGFNFWRATFLRWVLHRHNFWRNYGLIAVEYASRTWTSCHAKTTANTTVGINSHDSIHTFEIGIDGTNFYAWRIIAMHTGGGLPKRGCVIAILHGVYFDPVLMV